MKSEKEVLEDRLKQLEEENSILRTEISFLKTHPVFIKGFKGEQIVCDITSGQLTPFAAKYDLLTKKEIKVEIKYSKLMKPNLSSALRRWSWSKPLGYLDKGKDYDFLLLIGDKDYRFKNQYLDDSPYVFFLLPECTVRFVMTSGKSIGGNIMVTTNFQSIRSEKSKLIHKHMVASNDILTILGKG